MALRMISCEEAAKLISETMDHQLPLLERINLKMHLVMCKVCPTYMKNLHLLRQIIKGWMRQEVSQFSNKNLSQESKLKIKLHLR